MKEEAMPIYLVRWPDLTASLVRAEGEEHLLDILDQEANPEGAEWSVYKGPLAINFRLPAEWSIRDERPGAAVAPEQVIVDHVGAMADRSVVETMQVSLAGGDDGADTGIEILKKAFPAVHAAIERLLETEEGEDNPGALPESELRRALHAELARMLKASWRRAQVERSTDPVSKLARDMDLPVRLARRYAEIAAEKDEPGDDDDPAPRRKGS
jgi:hypothetical protein